MIGRIFDISRGCTDDGPGLRTTVFLKGCNLSCPWCHNIEGKSFEPEIAYDVKACIDCGLCEQACPRQWTAEGWRHGCTACGTCAAICPTRARKLVGRDITPDELVSEISRDMAFFLGTGGGVTFSGGEPLAQPNFLFACAGKLKELGIHLAVETSGYWPNRYVSNLVKLFDMILFDLKHVDPEKCRRSLGTDSQIALENLKSLIRSRLFIEVRITLIPGFNDANADLYAMADWLKANPKIPPVRIQPFHRLAVSKQELFQRAYAYAYFPPTPPARLRKAEQIFALR
ncbi:MAG: glycyl-radical enzyme activating protein [Deltaproteobacteria bacterium]|nr:glycyl-radical enzyme activating protein [Deltaproteobacteria bacterium]